MRNEVFNSKKSSLSLNIVNVNNFTVKPIRGEDGNNQICVTFDKGSANAISFFVDYRKKGSKEWISTHVEKVLNVINIKNLSPGIYQVRVALIGARQQTPSSVKEVEIVDDSPKRSDHEAVMNFANNLADDIISEVYFHLSNPDLIRNKEDYGLYDQSYLTD